MPKPLTLVSQSATAQQWPAARASTLPLFDEPVYNRDKLELTAETGRILTEKDTAKGLQAAKDVKKLLENMYKKGPAICRPNSVYGWSATVPLIAEVIGESGPRKLFLKYWDANNPGIAKEVAKEYDFQRDLWDRGVRTIPEPLLLDREKRLFISSQVEGVSAPKSIFETSEYQLQVMQFLSDVHALPFEHLLSKEQKEKDRKTLSLISIKAAIEDVSKIIKLDPDIAQGIAHYEKSIEKTLRFFYNHSNMARSVHGDMKAGNMVAQLDQKTIKFTDFGLAHSGDPASDIGFFVADVHLPISAVGSLLGQYRNSGGLTDDTFKERIELWTTHCRTERFVRYQEWFKNDPDARKSMAALVQQDYQVVRPLFFQVDSGMSSFRDAA